ncbi:hypothetical protein KAM345_042020 [Aeromonas caviae]|uniref:hypothetical protein n=1 Tax=Aeromonas caviae TaxID=648 RepID=UPI001CC44D26|nr:hypothetical protein [Aeromonas caviae]BDA20288.1 hypothetical protein KAM345_042020 [Aeromonas caviae]
MVRFSVLLMTASLIISPAYAVPNIWKGEFGQGFLALNINNESGDEFTIMCDLGYTETGEKTSASFRLGNGNDLSPSSNNKVEIVVDGNSYLIPEGVGFRSGDIAWEQFIHVINTASNFDIYVNLITHDQQSPRTILILRTVIEVRDHGQKQSPIPERLQPV